MRLPDNAALAHLLRNSRCKVAGETAKPAAGSVKARAAPATRSALEAELQAQLDFAGVPTPECDVAYLVGSRHRLDFCWRSLKFGVECQGLQHGIKGRFKQDIRKRVLGQLQGWLVVEVDGESIHDGSALTWIRQLLRNRQ